MRNLSPNQNFSLGAYNLHMSPPPFVHFETGVPQLGQMPRSQAPVSYVAPSNGLTDPFCAAGNRMTRDGAYIQWPSSAMMYAYPYEQQIRHGFFQVNNSVTQLSVLISSYSCELF